MLARSLKSEITIVGNVDKAKYEKYGLQAFPQSWDMWSYLFLFAILTHVVWESVVNWKQDF